MRSDCSTISQSPCAFPIFATVKNISLTHVCLDMVQTLIQELEEAAAHIKKIYSSPPQIGIVLGSGLGNLIKEFRVEKEIEYRDIPHFPLTTVEGHSGKLIFGELHGKKIVAMAGRFHYYEGYSLQQVVFPIRVLKWLGIKDLLISNAAGGMNKNFRVGDLMVIRDHISLFTENPLVGHNADAIGPRFPDMSEPYDRTLIHKLKTIAAAMGFVMHEGIYAGVTGPTFETRAEYKLLHMVGADAVGMSTVQEVIAARHLGLRVAALSVITDLGIREENNTITHKEVLQAASDAEPRLTAIFKELIHEL
jgi:purine-nucleoside phosphorylase